MNRYTCSSAIVVSLALLSGPLYAVTPAYTVDGTISTIIPINTTPEDLLTTSSAETLAGVKTIQLLRFTPSAEFLEYNAIVRARDSDKKEKDYSKGIKPFIDSDNSVDLGMNDVPVLDQGSHGTCVTFSTTAALDARFKLGDYIDQQCSLALNKSLGNDYWEGANKAAEITDPLKEYGFVKKGECFGTTYADPKQKVTAAKYKTISNKDHSDEIKTTFVSRPNLDGVKTALRAGHRIVMGTYIDQTAAAGFDVTTDGHTYKGGLWACEQPGSDDDNCPSLTFLLGGHAIVVIGYDDNQELLKIRNSWGKKAGDNGDWYMTYKFYNSMSVNYSVID